MARRSRKSGFEHTVEALARLPWQLCLALVPVAYLGFHQLALIEPPAAKNIGQLGQSASVMIFRTVGVFLQYLAPLTLLLAALVSWLGQRRRRKLLQETESRAGSEPLLQLGWREFEQLVGAHFERQGYSVSFTAEGADGGVDVIARKDGETFLIQCKQWRSTQVGVSVVRELFGVMAARGATGAYVVSIGAFTDAAREFAGGRNIELVDAHRLLLGTQRAGDSTSLTPAPANPAPASAQQRLCPNCNAPMVRRVAKQGPNAGQAFYGCSSYPKCRGTLPLSSS